MRRAQPFSSLARVYDAIFSDVEYDEWCAFTIEQLGSNWAGETLDPTAVKVLDMACGTGNSTVPYVGCGYEVWGVDLSHDMLKVAKEKLPGVRFVQQSFVELNLPQRFHLVTCVFDSLNNLTDPHDLEQTFARVYQQLEPGGWFVFDCNTRIGVRDLWDDGRFEGEAIVASGSVRFVWEHEFLADRQLGQVTARCWGGGFSFEEVHLERGYDADELSASLERVGFTEVRALEYPDDEPLTPDAPRVWVFARKGSS